MEKYRFWVDMIGMCRIFNGLAGHILKSFSIKLSRIECKVTQNAGEPDLGLVCVRTFSSGVWDLFQAVLGT